MYTEDYENRGFPFRDFLLKLILIIIFVFLLVWLLPKFIAPKVVENLDSNINSTEVEALGNQIFNENLNTMKEAAIAYYTDERLPKEIGESHKMTLSDMIGKKIITPLVDKNNLAVDVEKSYVRITKADDEYILKVNLKDSTKEDYILVYLGCYTYCDGYVCEKKDDTGFVKGEQPTPTPTPANPTPTPTTKEYLYRYTKKTDDSLSNWSSWTGKTQTSTTTKNVTCGATDFKCLKEQKVQTERVQIGEANKKYVTKYNDTVYVTSYSMKTCAGYTYTIIDEQTYASSTTYTVDVTSANWKKVGRATYSNPPTPTATTKYVWIGADYSHCKETCESLPKHIYDKYVYVGGNMSSVTNTTTTPSSTSVSATCNSYVTVNVPIYKTIEKAKTATRIEPVYGDIHYKYIRTRVVIPGRQIYEWSHYNDLNLLNNGWSYTGEKKLVD